MFSRYLLYLHTILDAIVFKGTRFAKTYSITNGVLLPISIAYLTPVLYSVDSFRNPICELPVSYSLVGAQIAIPYSITALTHVSNSASLTAGAIHFSVCMVILSFAIALLLLWIVD